LPLIPHFHHIFHRIQFLHVSIAITPNYIYFLQLRISHWYYHDWSPLNSHCNLCNVSLPSTDLSLTHSPYVTDSDPLFNFSFIYDLSFTKFSFTKFNIKWLSDTEVRFSQHLSVLWFCAINVLICYKLSFMESYVKFHSSRSFSLCAYKYNSIK
jgi:hypothetical protein